jgi:large subunit ribosomal protein L25
MEQIVLKSKPRTELGTRAARRIRREGLIPANVYGHGHKNLLLSVDEKALRKALSEGHRILGIEVEGGVEQGLVKEVQYDYLGSHYVHVDFTIIKRGEKVEVSVPVELMGTPKGVTGGGVLSFPLQELTISGLPEHLPEHFRLSVEALELGQALRLKDLTIPENCTLVGDPETVVVAVMHRREEAAVAPVEVAPVEPEVIGRKKEEAGEAEEGDGKGDGKGGKTDAKKGG